MYNDYMIRPEKDDRPLNGVSTFDLVLISKHILGITEFENPYQMIAADVNGSGTITAFDMVQIRQLILNIKTDFSHCDSWKFVEANYQFTTESPITENYSQVTQITDLRQDTRADFVAIKMGDVNGNARPSSLIAAEARTITKTFEIFTEDKWIKAGESYDLTFSTKQLADIQGYQFTLAYDDLKVDRLTSSLMDIGNFGLHRMDEGFITTSWNKAVALGSDQKTATELFTINFTALIDGKVSEQLNIIAHPTPIEAYNKHGELMDVQLNFTDLLLVDQFELFQNQPNPFHDKTMIGFYLPGDSKIQLTLRDETGRVLKSFKDDRKAGYNTIYLDKEPLTNGFIYYQLSTKFGTKAKKMLSLK